MAKFLFVYRGGEGDDAEMSPEEMQQIIQVWTDWIEGGTKAGWIVDGGTGLKPVGKVVHPDLTVTDGPFAEAKELVGGFSIVEADGLAAASEIAKGCPMPASGGTVEVREFMDYSME